MIKVISYLNHPQLSGTLGQQKNSYSVSYLDKFFNNTVLFGVKLTFSKGSLVPTLQFESNQL